MATAQAYIESVRFQEVKNVKSDQEKKDVLERVYIFNISTKIQDSSHIQINLCYFMISCIILTILHLNHAYKYVQVKTIFMNLENLDS